MMPKLAGHGHGTRRLGQRQLITRTCMSYTRAFLGCMEGAGEALSMPIKSWRLRFDDTGAFDERVELNCAPPPESAMDANGPSHDRSPIPHDHLDSDITLASGYDPLSRLWQSDLNGQRHDILPGDDAFDHALLSTWVRTGQWMAQADRGNLVVKEEEEGEEGSFLRRILSLPGSPVQADLILDEGKHPRSLSIQTHSGGRDLYEWSSWPDHCIHTLSTGQRATYVTMNHGQSVNKGPSDGNKEKMVEKLESLSTEAGSSDSNTSPGSAEMDVARAEGGQFLLRVKLYKGGGGGGGPISLDSQPSQPSWFLLDTCCETSCVTPSLALSLSLPPSFGSQEIHTIGSSLSTPMRRGLIIDMGSYHHNGQEKHVLTLPPTHVYQQLSLDGSVVAPTLESGVSGILGGSMLNRCLLEIKAPKRSPGAKSPPKPTARVYSTLPEFEREHQLEDIQWHRLHFIDSQPHVEATMFLDENQSGLTGLFRLSLGIGGVACILSTRAARDLCFLDQSTPLMVQGGLMAGPGSSMSRFERLDEDQVLSFRAHRLRIGKGLGKGEGGGEGDVGGRGGFELLNLRTIVHLGEVGVRGLIKGGEGKEGLHAPPDLALSLRASGLIGADAIRGCSIVIDYPGKRVAFIST